MLTLGIESCPSALAYSLFFCTSFVVSKIILKFAGESS